MRHLCWGLLLLLSVSLAQETKSIDPKYAPLAQQLLTATEPDRATLLASHPELADHTLVSAMTEITGRVLDREDYEHALAMYDIVCSVARSLQDKLGEANCEHNIGLTLGQLYRNEESLRHLDQALNMYQSLGGRREMITTLNSIGIRFHRTGDMNTALPYLQRALAEAERFEDPIGIAQSSLNLGNFYQDSGRYRDAIRSMVRALEITRTRPELLRRTAMILNSLGSTYFDQHELDLAINYHTQSLDLKEKAHAPNSELASSVLNLARDYERKAVPEKALSYYDRAVELTAGNAVLKTRATALHNYGAFLHSLGRTADALPKLTESMEISRRTEERGKEYESRIELATIAVEEHRYQDAVRELGPIVDFARRENIPTTLIRADDVLGVALQCLGRKSEAEAAFEEAIRTVERLRAELPGEKQAMARFMSEEVNVYRHMILAQADNGHPELALAYAERSKGRTLLDVLQSAGKPVAKTLTPAEISREESLTERLNLIQEQMMLESQRRVPNRKSLTALGADMEKARNELRSFELQLYTAHPELRVQRVAFDPSAPADLAASVPDPDVAMFEYAMTDAGPFLFVLTRTPAGLPSLKHYRLGGDLDALSRDVHRFREQVATRDLGYRKLGAALYQQLIEPAREQLRGKKTLIVVPDGILWELPFQALQSRADRHLLEDYAIFYSPSLSVLREMEKLHHSRQIPSPRVMAVEALAAASGREVNGLREVYGASNVRVLSGGEADHDRIKQEASNYDVLHFSAHGVFQNRNPMESYLVLAKAGKPEAGLLPAREMMNLDLHADMVVLAGCETGRGESGSGEGLIGMSWALFIAGSPATVASQWKVDAESTGDFMLEFHRRLRGSTKAKALQGAALSVMQKPQFRHPFYWSGFVLLGEGF
jgi:CHAT domain-containing protein